MAESQLAADTFLDRWGHWILWMGSYILIVSLVAWTPRLALLLVGVELLQFTLHVRESHPTHPMTQQIGLFIVVAMLLVIVGLLVCPFTGWAYIIAFCQIMYSQQVHDWTHSRNRLDAVGIVCYGAIALLFLKLLIEKQVIHSLPTLHTYLFTG